MNITVTKASELKPLPTDESALGFGRIFTDHMFVMKYQEGRGWFDGEIKPFGDLSLSPASMVLHYAQEIFEGLKAYRVSEGNDGDGDGNGKVQLFRPDENFARLNVSAERLVIPKLPEDVCLSALKELVRLDSRWVPRSNGASLYIRPFVIATDHFIGVSPAQTYLFIIIMSPSGAYYKTGFSPVGIRIEEEYVRTVKGGTGFVKTGGNYAASLIGQERAHADGYDQVLWLDGRERKYIEEVGSMNIFFVINESGADGKPRVITPAIEGSILSGITRKSVITLCRDRGYEVEERRVSIDEIIALYDAGKLIESFGTGTAAVISPVGRLKYKTRVLSLNGGKTGELAAWLFDTMTGIQYGRLPDPHGWMFSV